MDARQLRYFLAVVDEGGISKAADKLFIAQPSLSQAVSTLERDLGVPLFHRIGRRLVLSDAGRELIGPARVVLRDLENARASVQAVRQLRAGTVDLITMPSPGIEPLTSILAAFAHQYPRVTVNSKAAFVPDEVVRSVRSGDSEIGVLGSETLFKATDLDVVQLESQPLVLICGSAPQAPPAGDVARTDLTGMRLIVSQRGSLMRALVDDILASGVDITIAVEVAHRTSILPMVTEGIGHAIMPSSWTRTALQAGATVHRIVPESYLHVSMISRTTDLTPPAESLISHARAYAEKSSTSTL